MHTLGVDLASSAERTATCVIEWADSRANIRHLVVGADDDAITSLAGDADAVGIDAPFGWPTPFVELLAGKSRPRTWTHERRDELRFRATDHHVRRETQRWPLSVSSDRIGVVAMRCHQLLQRLRLANPAARERTLEVYPAAVLRRWGLVAVSYKGAERRAALDVLVGQLLSVATWLDVSDEQGRLLRRSDHALDAMISSLVARAARLGLADATPDDPRTQSEGWIVLPKDCSLSVLAKGALGA
ncbi:MAG: DUF429 domain-containing protein [Planctomycetota bacterium]